MRSQLGPVVLDVCTGWANTTGDVAAEPNQPWTLTRQAADACGSLQFSVALYRGGPIPDPTPEALAELLRGFGETHGLSSATDEITEPAPLRLAAATFRDAEWMIRAWYVSDGRSFAKVTYTTGFAEAFHSELAECERMVRSIRFVADRPR
jgi:hypothetical protein